MYILPSLSEKDSLALTRISVPPSHQARFVQLRYVDHFSAPVA